MLQTVKFSLEAAPERGRAPVPLSFWPTQNDRRAYRFLISVFSGNAEIDYGAAENIHVIFEKPDGMLVRGRARAQEGAIVYDLGTTELQAVGRVEGAVQFCTPGASRLTTQRFVFYVLGDPLSAEAIESTSALPRI